MSATKLSAEELAELKLRYGRSTQSTLRIDPTSPITAYAEDERSPTIFRAEDTDYGPDDAAFFVTAANLMPKIIAALEAQRAEGDAPLFLVRVTGDGAGARLVRGHEALARAVCNDMCSLSPGEEPPEDVREMMEVARDPHHPMWEDCGYSDAPALFWNFEDGSLAVFKVTDGVAPAPSAAPDGVVADARTTEIVRGLAIAASAQPDETSSVAWAIRAGITYIGTLTARLAQAEREREREERLHTDTINRRDLAEDALGEMYAAVMGEGPEWSNLYQYDDAVNDCADRLEKERASLTAAPSLNRPARAAMRRESEQKAPTDSRAPPAP